MARGTLITFEGVEGCGKSTQLGLLVETLRGRGAAVVTTREPGGTPLGERVRELLLHPASDPVALAELFLLEAARTQLVARIVVPALAAGSYVLADRFSDSSLAYQGGGRELGAELVASLNRVACGDVVPDRTLVLHLPVEVALARARRRPTTTAANSRFEDEEVAFHRRVADAFARLAAAAPARVRLVDAAGSPETVHGRVLAAVADLLP